MHELSLANEVISLASREAGSREISAITEILMEVGYLSGVEADAFQSALELISGGTVLEGAVITILHTPGTGKCNACNLEFEMRQRTDSCPVCHCFPSEIKGGDEFRIVSFTGE